MENPNNNEKEYSEEYYSLCNEIREELLAHLQSIGFDADGQKLSTNSDDKNSVRNYHSFQRSELLIKESTFVRKFGSALLHKHFANGTDIVPENVKPVISLVNSDTEDGNLFRFASLLWSVPVSSGYGRRMRFIVRDQSNGKLIGIFALADPVFNLSARDKWVGWNSDLRKKYLVNVMDASVVGAVPPYNQLLGGKVVASMMTSQQVVDAFNAKYGQSQGIISKEKKHARLALITVTSALGRSSLYNRLRLPGLLSFINIGETSGWGHFQVSQALFQKMRHLLSLAHHKYADGHQFGDGPNWRIRVIREGVTRAGLNPDVLLRHGIAREIYVCPLLDNWKEILLGEQQETKEVYRPDADMIARAAVQRWLLPRAQRVPEYRNWTIQDTWAQLFPEQPAVPTQIQLPLLNCAEN